MSSVTPSPGNVTDAAKKQCMADLDTFGSLMSQRAKEKAPPPPKFGNIPHTGHNRDSIDYQQSNMHLQVYTESGYGGFLEIGTSKMAARPYFKPAFDDTRKAFR